jgi:hypothetical protein
MPLLPISAFKACMGYIFTLTFYSVVKGYTSKKKAGFDAMELKIS